MRTHLERAGRPHLHAGDVVKGHRLAHLEIYVNTWNHRRLLQITKSRRAFVKLLMLIVEGEVYLNKVGLLISIIIIILIIIIYLSKVGHAHRLPHRLPLAAAGQLFFHCHLTIEVRLTRSCWPVIVMLVLLMVVMIKDDDWTGSIDWCEFTFFQLRLDTLVFTAAAL